VLKYIKCKTDYGIYFFLKGNSRIHDEKLAVAKKFEVSHEIY
jgi:hypothetical protein